ncbi:MAG: nitrate reductase subunit beta [candidate division WOR-3 bacterium]
MDVRIQISMVFHLDKCIGCHTCSISCKNVWTDRKGAEYMWWNNVETKPGTGYPTLWEDQEKYKGGWEKKDSVLKPKLQGKLKGLLNIFYNPFLPTIDDYYEPWTYRYSDLFDSPPMDDQPSARPISLITGKTIDVESGPNWDDDLSGTPFYAKNDPNLKNLTEEEKNIIFEMENIFHFYLPRICNHCLNPTCVAVCPSGAIYKRGEDGIVLVSQDKCRGWRMCVSGCPYKKVYYNYETGKSEKCILCYPRVETGQAPMCFHSCVGRIRYMGVLLYDAEKIESAIKSEDKDIVKSQLDLILDPFDNKVIENLKKKGIKEEIIEYAQNSPVYKFVKKFKIALPLHPEFRTLPMLFYVPPLLPVKAKKENCKLRLLESFFSEPENFRAPIKYLASLFSAGDENLIKDVYKRLIAVRIFKRWKEVGDLKDEEKDKYLKEAGLDEKELEEIFELTSIASIEKRFVIPPSGREEMIDDVYKFKGETGFGYKRKPERRW